MSITENKIVVFAVIFMAVYFFAAHPVMMDDGYQYEGFAESLAGGKLDFRSYYGFQGLSILSVPVFWLTGSKISIIITSSILYLLSLPLAYVLGRDFYSNKKAGILFMLLIILMPYVYTTMMRGFQEAALLFFILLIIYGSVNKKLWTPVIWSFGGMIKPFALVLFTLFAGDFLNKKKFIWPVIGLLMGAAYLGASYYQTGHLVNNAAINSYEGNFNVGNPPPLIKSFAVGIKGFLRVGANLILHYRKILLSPLAIILGGLALYRSKKLRFRREIIAAVLLNILLVGVLTFSFSKYLLPIAVLLALASVDYLLKYKWLMPLVIADSLFVFMPMWGYYRGTFWDNVFLYLIPLWLAIIIYLIYEYGIGKHNNITDSQRETKSRKTDPGYF